MTPMPLSAALQKHFPDGGITLSTMQNAIRQGKLNCSRLGRVYMVTAEDIQDWMKSCRVERKQGSISASEKAENQDGSFSTADENTQQAISESFHKEKSMKPWTCYIGLHKWRHLETHYAPTRYDEQPFLQITIMGRRFHFKECEHCEKWKQYYPWKSPDPKDDIWDYPEQECPWK